MLLFAPSLLPTAPDWPDPRAWALEPIRDGCRMAGGQTRCSSRRGTDLTGRVPDVLGELRKLLRAGTLVDGERGAALIPWTLGELLAGDLQRAGYDERQLEDPCCVTAAA